MDLAINNDKQQKRQSIELSCSIIIILLGKTARALVVSIKTPCKMVCACFVIFRAYQKSTYLSIIYRFTETLSTVEKCPLTPNSSQGRLGDYIHWRSNIAEMGLSFKKLLCLKLNTKSIFKVNNTANDPFSLINITHILQSLRCPVAPFSPLYIFKTILVNCTFTLPDYAFY